MVFTPVDRVFFHGNILTMEEDCPNVEAIGICHNKIVCLGKKEDVLKQAGSQTEWIDLKGHTLMPGFIESHMHLSMIAEYLLEIDVKGALNQSIAKMLAAIAQKAKEKPPGTWILGGGWDEGLFAENRIFTRWDLDRAAPAHPVVMRRVCTHVWVVNSKVLAMNHIDKDTPDPPGGIIDKDPLTGEPTGILKENALNLIRVPEYDFADLKEKIHAVQQTIVAKGITTANEITLTKQGFRAYQELAQEKRALCRIRPWAPAVSSIGRDGLLSDFLAIGMESGYGDDMVRFQGVKFFTDGAMKARTAAMKKAYPNHPDEYGCLIFADDDELTAQVQKAVNANIRVALHAIGDRAIEQVLICLERVNQQKDITGMRNRIEHCIYPTGDHIDRMKKLGVAASLSTGFIDSLGNTYYDVLGAATAQDTYPARSLLDKGILVSGNADCPICDFNPFLGIYGAVARKTDAGKDFGQKEAITVPEALQLYTINAAKACFEEEKIGSLRVGKYADLTIVDQNPLTAPLEEIKEIRVLATIMDGNLVYGTLK